MEKFAHPALFWLLTSIPLIVAAYLWADKKGVSMQVSRTPGMPRTWRTKLRHIPFSLQLAAIALLVVALARPRTALQHQYAEEQGIDIALAVDISTSMLARDLHPDRIEAAKTVASEFVAARRGDRIALVAFAGEAFTLSPLTTDQTVLQTQIARLRSGVVEDGTAIGNGLATCVNRLRESEAKSKVVILLTDGENNRGEIAPLMAAQIARDHGIRLYTVGVGRRGQAPYPTVDAFGNPTIVYAQVQIDEKLLKEMAEMTGGQYFRATDNRALQAIYAQIDRLETTPVPVTDLTTWREEFLPWLLTGLGLLVVAFLLQRTVFAPLCSDSHK